MTSHSARGRVWANRNREGRRGNAELMRGARAVRTTHEQLIELLTRPGESKRERVRLLAEGAAA